MSTKSSSDTIGNRTLDHTVCSAVPQQTAPPAACPEFCKIFIMSSVKYSSQHGQDVFPVAITFSPVQRAEDFCNILYISKAKGFYRMEYDDIFSLCKLAGT
jgi:hypothetical protein